MEELIQQAIDSYLDKITADYLGCLATAIYLQHLRQHLQDENMKTRRRKKTRYFNSRIRRCSGLIHRALQANCDSDRFLCES